MITVSGMECAGSTAVWQMINQLGFQAKKEHGYTRDVIVFATLRDIRDVVTSLWRRECLGLRNDPDNYALGCFRYALPRYESMCRYEKDDNAIIIRYEDFVRDPGNTLDLICKTLAVTITLERRAEILESCSLKKNKERASRLADFSEWDSKDLIHGNHISTNGKVGSWSDLAVGLKPETVEFIEDGAREFLVHFNYET